MRTIKASSLGFTRLPSPLLRYFRRRPISALGSLVIGASLMSLGASFVQNNRPDPATACANIANLGNFPVTDADHACQVEPERHHNGEWRATP